jgi:HD-GYP domain-containing protein (c-di-GMP phosphodiesterase class II)
MQQHTELGYRMLKGSESPFLRLAATIAWTHHERFDGEGYPRGLATSNLSLDTRILTVCDVYDALVSPRVYRNAWSHEAAIGLLRQETGSAFDERCVAALEAVLGREQPQSAAPVLRVAAASA